MNWRNIGIEALLPLIVALGAALATGALQALRLTRLGVASRPAFFRMLRAMALAFPITFLVVTFWVGRRTWAGLFGVVLHHPMDQRAMGLLRAQGEGFLVKDAAKAAYWYRKSAENGDADGQLLLAQALFKNQDLSRDPAEALRWAKAAAEQGQPEAMVLTGDRLRSTDAGTANAWYQRALRIYRQRVQSRDADACLAYGQLRFEGKGAEVDRVEGLAWMYVSRWMGIRSFKGVTVQIAEGGLSPAQRVEAAKRAGIILKTIPQPG